MINAKELITALVVPHDRRRIVCNTLSDAYVLQTNAITRHCCGTRAYTKTCSAMPFHGFRTFNEVMSTSKNDTQHETKWAWGWRTNYKEPAVAHVVPHIPKGKGLQRPFSGSSFTDKWNHRELPWHTHTLTLTAWCVFNIRGNATHCRGTHCPSHLKWNGLQYPSMTSRMYTVQTVITQTRMGMATHDKELDKEHVSLTLTVGWSAIPFYGFKICRQVTA